MLPLFRLCRGIFIYRKAFINQFSIFETDVDLILTKKVTKSKHHRLVTNIEEGYPFFTKKGKAFIEFLKITFKMKKGMLFGLSHREKRLKKINLIHFPVFT